MLRFNAAPLSPDIPAILKGIKTTSLGLSHADRGRRPALDVRISLIFHIRYQITTFQFWQSNMQLRASIWRPHGKAE